MSATEEKRLSPPSIQKLGILAGGGNVPFTLLKACDEMGIEPFIVAFEGHAEPSLTEGRTHIWSRLGAVGSILKTLHKNDVHDLVLIGSIRRPSLKELRPDLKAASFFAKEGASVLGDDGLLSALKRFLGDEGFTVHGAHIFAQGLITPKGALGEFTPDAEHAKDIKRGAEVLNGMSGLDVGQAVIVQEGIVLGVEAAEGTDALIERCVSLKREGRGGVLVKMCKTEQDRDLDMPTIGPQTIELAAQCGLSGVAIHAGHSMLLDKEEVAQIANAHKIFVIGLDY